MKETKLSGAHIYALHNPNLISPLLLGGQFCIPRSTIPYVSLHSALGLHLPFCQMQLFNKEHMYVNNHTK